MPRNPRSPVSKSKGATDASSSKATGSRTAPIIKIEIEGSCRSAGEGGVAGRDRDRDMALVASQSKAFTAPSGDCGDQRNGEISNQDDRGKDEMDIQASEADHLNLNDSQTATEVTWGEDLDDEQCDIQSDREMKEFWENRFNEQGARGKRLNEIRCAYEAMSAAGELKLAKSESDEGILEGEDMGEEMEEE